MIEQQQTRFNKFKRQVKSFGGLDYMWIVIWQMLYIQEAAEIVRALRVSIVVRAFTSPPRAD